MSVDMKLVQETMENLKKRQFRPFFVEKKEDVLPLLKTLVAEGETVANGGSVTLGQCGVTDWLKNGSFNYLVPTAGMTDAEKKNITRQRFFADSFFLSANAIISDGRIYNEDGASTRVAPMIYGPDKVFVVAGINKIVTSQAEAVKRTKWVAPQNCKRIGFDTPCVEDGLCHNCFHFQRSCCTTAILNFSRIPDRISVILVGEDLGV
ncbi:MAG: lactate utilization protein [Oscillospiraceae bacterium]|nr:lactate utilization protein [Oscillospiraceae bacterium]